MKVRIVGFQKTIGMPNFSNDRPLVVEADLEEGETMGEAWSKMNQTAIDWHKAEYPHLYQEVVNHPMANITLEERAKMYTSAPPIPQVIDYKQKESLEISIDNAATLEDLAKLKQEAGANGLVSQYMKRLNELVIK